MKLELDETKLADHAGWQTRNFERKIETLKYMLQHFLDVELPSALRYINYERDSVMGPRTHVDAAAEITHALQQTVANCDLRGLVSDAGDLTQTLAALGALADLKLTLPDEIMDAWNEHELAGKAERDGRAEAEDEKRRQRIAGLCEASVHESGRGVGFRQCTKKHTGLTTLPDGSTMRTCTVHRDSTRRHVNEHRTLDTSTRRTA